MAQTLKRNRLYVAIVAALLLGAAVREIDGLGLFLAVVGVLVVVVGLPALRYWDNVRGQ